MMLAPDRYVRARLSDPSHKLPWQGRLFGVGGEEPGFETVDLWSPFTQLLLADGSIVRATGMTVSDPLPSPAA